MTAVGFLSSCGIAFAVALSGKETLVAVAALAGLPAGQDAPVQTHRAQRPASPATTGSIGKGGAETALKLDAPGGERASAQEPRQAGEKRGGADKAARADSDLRSRPGRARAEVKPVAAPDRESADTARSAPLAVDSPRWTAEAGHGSPPAAAEGRKPARSVETAQRDRPLSPSLHADISLASKVPAPTMDAYVAVAETEAEVRALEAAMAESALPYTVRKDMDATVGRLGLLPRRLTATNAVNMRKSADVAADIVAVVPRGGKVAAAADCERWCRVAYDGQRGWIRTHYLTDGPLARRPRAQRRSKPRGTRQAAQDSEPPAPTVKSHANYLRNAGPPPDPVRDPIESIRSRR